jgi:transposase InsO family protein
MDRAPRQVYATLLDEGTYLCHWRTMYRVLAAHAEVRERRRQRRHPKYHKPELLAEGPNQVWSWDITKLRGPAKWTCHFTGDNGSSASLVLLDSKGRQTAIVSSVFPLEWELVSLR